MYATVTTHELKEMTGAMDNVGSPLMTVEDFDRELGQALQDPEESLRHLLSKAYNNKK